jgi:two-component system, chemotaxis family, protein-glutamate methylesterase/glutaminase
MNDNKRYDLVVIGGSAGSLGVVLNMLPHLKKEMNICVIVIFHRKSAEETSLVEMFTHRTEFAVRETGDKDELSPGVIYIASPDYHLLIEKDMTLTLDASEKVNYSRPSIDVTFECAAEVYGEKLMCILLSGANDDGVNGLIRAKELGAFIVVQDPKTAESPFMPQSAVDRVEVDLLLTDNNLQDLVNLLVTTA